MQDIDEKKNNQQLTQDLYSKTPATQNDMEKRRLKRVHLVSDR